MLRSVIIVAGGKGLRIGTAIPKQFLLIGDKPILMHTIMAFYRADNSMRIIVVLPLDQQIYWKQLCKEYHFNIKHEIATGGKTRFDSVKNGISLIPEHSIVGVHDGVRPFVSKEVIDRCYREAEKYEAVIPVIPVIESIRKISINGDSFSANRTEYRMVQTPQVFDSALLNKAYEQPYRSLFTDDASVVESYGAKIYITEGNIENIKITTPYDMVVANAVLKCQE